MRRIFVFVLCWFIPSKRLRDLLREKYCVESGRVKIKGKNNHIILVKNGIEHRVRRIPGCNIYIHGDNNTIKIHEPIKRLHLSVKMYGNSNLEIMSGTVLDRRFDIRGMINCNVFIGSGVFTNSQCLVECADGADIHIGNNCMFSDNVELRAGDGHTILNTKGKKINTNKSIYISDHVWLGKYVMVLKGVKISKNSIVGARSLVTKSFDDDGVIIAGVPAKVIKTGINWKM